MARIRTIKPEFWESEKVGRMTILARLTFLGLISLADDEGRGRGAVAFLRSRLHAWNTPTEEEFQEVLVEIESNGLAVFYQAEDCAYYQIPGWTSNQRIDSPNPSQFPPPPGYKGIGLYPTKEVRDDVYQRDSFICAYCSRDLKDSPKSISLDHVIPIALGGTHNKQNLVTSCKKCNALKWQKTPEQGGLKHPAGFGQYAEKWAAGSEAKRGTTPVPTPQPPPGVPGGSLGKERKGKERKGKELSIIPEVVGVVVKPRTPLQKTVESYKMAKGIDRDDKGWDRANFARYAKAAASLLDRFGGDEVMAAKYMFDRAEHYKAEELSWTLETVAKHAWDGEGLKMTEDEDGRKPSEVDATRVLERRRGSSTAPAGALVGDAMRAIETSAVRDEGARELDGVRDDD